MLMNSAPIAGGSGSREDCSGGSVPDRCIALDYRAGCASRWRMGSFMADGWLGSRSAEVWRCVRRGRTRAVRISVLPSRASSPICPNETIHSGLIQDSGFHSAVEQVILQIDPLLQEKMEVGVLTVARFATARRSGIIGRVRSSPWHCVVGNRADGIAPDEDGIAPSNGVERSVAAAARGQVGIQGVRGAQELAHGRQAVRVRWRQPWRCCCSGCWSDG